jgi:hypothetical protein
MKKLNINDNTCKAGRSRGKNVSYVCNAKEKDRLARYDYANPNGLCYLVIFVLQDLVNRLQLSV